MERFSTASCCLASISNVAVMVISPLSIAAMEAGVPNSLFNPPAWRDRPLFVLYLAMGALMQAVLTQVVTCLSLWHFSWQANANAAAPGEMPPEHRRLAREHQRVVVAMAFCAWSNLWFAAVSGAIRLFPLCAACSAAAVASILVMVVDGLIIRRSNVPAPDQVHVWLELTPSNISAGA